MLDSNHTLNFLEKKKEIVQFICQFQTSVSTRWNLSLILLLASHQSIQVPGHAIRKKLIDLDELYSIHLFIYIFCRY